MESITIDKPELIKSYIDKAVVVSTLIIDNEQFAVCIKIEGITYKAQWFIDDAEIDHSDERQYLEYAFMNMHIWKIQ